MANPVTGDAEQDITGAFTPVGSIVTMAMLSSFVQLPGSAPGTTTAALVPSKFLNVFVPETKIALSTSTISFGGVGVTESQSTNVLG